MKCLRITVRGRVQGVFYRKSTLQTARRIGITGWVSNLPNGNVYIEAEGSNEKLEEFLGWCKEGPPMSRVDQVNTSERPIQNFDSFKIK